MGTGDDNSNTKIIKVKTVNFIFIFLFINFILFLNFT